MAPPTILPNYIWVHAVEWECSEEQTDRWPWPIYIFPPLCLTRKCNDSTHTQPLYAAI